MRNRFSDFTILALVAVGILAFFLGFVSISFWLVVMLIYSFTCNRDELGVFLLIAGSGLCGRMFAIDRVNTIVISVALILGIVLSIRRIMKIFLKDYRSYFFLALFIIFFFIEFSLGPQSDYAKEKIMKLTVRSLLWLTCFLIYVNSTVISNRKLALMFLLLAMFYMSQSSVLYGVHPSSILDISFFRSVAETVGRNDYGTLVVNPHTLGYLGVFPLVLWFSDIKLSVRIKESILLFIVCVLLIVFSGTRQVFVSMIVIMAMRVYANYYKRRITSTILIVSIVLLAYLFLMYLGPNYLTTMLEGENASVRLHRDLSTPIIIMGIDPFMGVGFGAYPEYANKNYPHNLFLELLCEMGLIGTTVFFLLIAFFIFYNKNRKFFLYQTAHGCYFIMIFLLFFLRSLISGDLAESMSCITALMAFVYIPKTSEKEEANI